MIQTEPVFSTDPIKDRVIANLMRSQNTEQFENSKKYARMANLLYDPLVQEWLDIRKRLHFNDEVPF